MRKEVELAYQQFREGGPTQVCRAGSRFINRKYYDWKRGSRYNSGGVNIHSESWDNLIILDACRFDYFKEYNWLDGSLDYRISRGSASKEFIRGNFIDQRAYDTVYLSDNPWYARLYEQLDSDLYHFSFCERDAFDGTVSYPSTVTESAVDYDSRFPHKRLIVHYMQPHAPYFNTDGTERFRWPGDDYDDCDPRELKDVYVDNLELVLSEVQELLDTLVGKTVITSDHGELLGERLPPCPLRQYQHPEGIYVEQLVKVPWLTVDSGERKRIIDEEDSMDWKTNDPQADEIDTQLEALGYI